MRAPRSNGHHMGRRPHPSQATTYFFNYTEQVSFLERTLSEIYVSSMGTNKASA